MEAVAEVNSYFDSFESLVGAFVGCAVGSMKQLNQSGNSYPRFNTNLKFVPTPSSELR